MKLRDQKLKNYQVYIERYIKNLVIATNQKSVIDIHKNKNTNITLKIGTKSQQKEGKGEKAYKSNPQNRWIKGNVEHTYQ